MRIALIVLTLLTLTSCGAMNKESTTQSGSVATSTTSPGETTGTNNPCVATPIQSASEIPDASGTTVQKVDGTKIAEGTYATLNYTLRDGNGCKVLETTLYSVAQSNGIAGVEGDFKPFSVMVGSSSLIEGFESGIMGMKKGDKKTIEVPPELGYGTGGTMTTVPKYAIAPVFTLVRDKSVFANTITETVPLEKIPEDMKNAKVGQEFNVPIDAMGNTTTGKVTAIDAKGMTITIENKSNPFYNKKLEVGATSENPEQGSAFKIIAIEGTGVTVEVTNTNSPFFNKNFAVGESVELPSGKIEIKKIDEETIDIEQSHPMAGKTLYFEIEVVDVMGGGEAGAADSAENTNQ